MHIVMCTQVIDTVTLIKASRSFACHPGLIYCVAAFWGSNLGWTDRSVGCMMSHRMCLCFVYMSSTFDIVIVR